PCPCLEDRGAAAVAFWAGVGRRLTTRNIPTIEEAVSSESGHGAQPHKNILSPPGGREQGVSSSTQLKSKTNLFPTPRCLLSRRVRRPCDQPGLGNRNLISRPIRHRHIR